MMVMSESTYLPWSPSCDEYFASFGSGRFDEPSQLWFIVPIEQTSINSMREALIVGYAGCDGIEFCFRAGKRGVWAYYPQENRWTLLAQGLSDFERGWLSGAIEV
jgi:hypothetical protein